MLFAKVPHYLSEELPISQPFTRLEAWFQYDMDLYLSKERSEREYSRMWSWGRDKVARFISEIHKKTTEERLTLVSKNNPPITSQRPAKHQPLKALKNSMLQEATSQTPANDQPNTSQLFIREEKRENTLSFFFEILWKNYPAKDGKKKAMAHFGATVKNEADCQRIKIALDNYLATLKRDHESGFNRHPKSGHRWFENWLDWEHQTPPVSATPRRLQVAL